MSVFKIPVLQKVDNYLLLHYPKIWITRVHHVLIYGFSLWVLSALLGFIIPVNLQSTEDLGLWYFIFSILSFTLFCFWVYHHVIFNNEKKFGNRKPIDSYLNFFFTFLCSAIFILAPLPFSLAYNNRVAHVVSDDEFIADINQLNRAEAYMLSNAYNYKSHYDSIEAVYKYDYRQLIEFNPNTPAYLKTDTIRFKNLLSAFQLKKEFKLLDSEKEVKTIINSYYLVLKKYHLASLSQTDFVNKSYNRYKLLIAQSPIATDSYNNYSDDFNNLERCFRNIYEAKFQKIFIYDIGFLNFLLYSVFYTTLLIVLFKLVNWQQYLISLITLLLLPIILFIFTQFIPYSGYDYGIKQNAYLISLALVFIACKVFTIKSLFNNKKFNAFNNICNQLFFITLPVFPLIVLSIIKPLFYRVNVDIAATEEAEMVEGFVDKTNYQSVDYLYNELLNQYWQKQYDFWLYALMYGSIIAFVLFVLPFMHQLLVKQIALPRKK